MGVGDSTLYDHVLDWTVRLGLIPERYQGLQGLDRYFAMARGAEGIPALELTKWFDTNYHYLVPEIETELTPSAHFDDFLETTRRAQKVLGERTVPIVLGPVTFLRLARLSQDFSSALDALLPVYSQLLGQLKALGVVEVQLHEPALVLADGHKLAGHVDVACRRLAEVRTAHQPRHLLRRFGRGLRASPLLPGENFDFGSGTWRQPTADQGC